MLACNNIYKHGGPPNSLTLSPLILSVNLSKF